jgi:putative sugar O-methyltransferase
MTWVIDKTVEERYLEACRVAATDDAKFSVFKENSAYQVILEHIPPEAGAFYYQLIKEKAYFEENLDKFAINDSVGSPVMINYQFGILSPSTVRYAMNTCNIHTDLGDSYNKVVEIGGGYGGLGVVLSSVLNVDEYVLIDHADANMLSQRYTSEFDLPTAFRVVDYTQLEEINDIGLVISNYALSELSVDLQTEYYDKVISNSSAVYITYNFIHQEAWLGYELLVSKLKNDGFNISISPEMYANMIICGKR